MSAQNSRYFYFFYLISLLTPHFLAAQTLLDSHNYFWRVTEEGGLTCFDGYSWQDLSAVAGIKDDPVLLLYEDAQQRVWVSVAKSESLLFFDSQHYVHRVVNNTGIRQLNIVAATESDGQLFFQEKDGTVLSIRAERNELWRVFDRKRDNLTFETPTPSIPIYYDPQLRRPLLKKPAILKIFAQNPTQTGIPLGKERLMLTPDGELNHYDQNGKLLHTLYLAHRHLPEMKEKSAWTKLERFGNTILVGTSSGVVFLDIDLVTQKKSEVRLLPSDYNITNFRKQQLDTATNYVRIGAVHDFSEQKDSVWIASENGLFLFQPKKNVFQRIKLHPKPEQYPEVTDLTTEGGHLRFVEGGELRILATLPQHSPVILSESGYINNVNYDARRGVYWASLATGGIVQVWQYDGRLRRRMIEESRFDRVKKLYSDKKGVLWGLTSHHVLRIVANNEGYSFHRFETQVAETALDFCIDEERERIVVFSENAIYDASLKQFQPLSYRPFLKLENIKINGSDTAAIARKFVLNYDDRTVLLRYKAISAYDTNDFLYKYRIKTESKHFRQVLNKKNEWQFTTHRELNLVLEDGHHELEIVAISNTGNKSLPLTFRFSVSPPIWTQAWFWLLILLVLSGLVVASLFAYSRRLESKNEFLKMEVRMLQAQMNTHFIANALTAIQGFIMSNKKLNALNYIVDFHGLMRMFLDASRTNEHLLEKELQLIKNYVRLQQLFQQFNYVLEMDEEVYPNDLLIPTSLIQPLVENAIIHGLQYKQSEEKNLYLRFFRTRYELTCEIEDDGIGRAASRSINAAKDRFKKFSTGISGKIIQNRLHLLNNYDNYKVNIFYEDLFKDEKPAGTKVILKIGLPKKITEHETID